MKEQVIENPKSDEHVVVEKNSNKTTKINNKKVFMACGVLVALLLVIFLCVFMLVLSPKRVLKSYVSGVVNGNSSKVVATMDENFLKGFKASRNLDFKNVLEEQFENRYYEITDYEINYNYNKYSDLKTKKYKKMLSTYFGVKSKDIEEVREYKVRCTIKYKDGTIDYSSIYPVLAKMNGKWYVFPVVGSVNKEKSNVVIEEQPVIDDQSVIDDSNVQVEE